MSGGARVVPIIIGRDKEYYRKVGIVQVLVLIRTGKKTFQNSLDFCFCRGELIEIFSINH